MRDRPLESDWKAFRRMVPECRERYLQKVNVELAGILSAGEATPTERFWDLKKRIREETKILCACFDGHSRSKMWLFLALMYRYGMLSNEDVNSFSDELREGLVRLRELS